MVRYEWPRPGDLLHMDVKKPGRFEAPGHALTGDRRRRSRRIGWEYVHWVADDCSRLAYAEIHDDERAPTVVGFTRRALEFLECRGIGVERLTTDNHFSHTKSTALAELLDRRAVSHLLIRPNTPRNGGKVERFRQTLMREWWDTPPAARAARRCHTGWATITSGAPTPPSATGRRSRAFGTCWVFDS